MKIFTFIVLGMLLISACSTSQASNLEGVSHVSAADFKALIEKGEGQLIDIRTPGEYQAGHIEGAKMIDFYAPTYKSYMNELDKETPIYIYCRSGNRSGKSVALLRELGFKEIVNLQRGINDWRANGFGLVN